MCVCSATPVAKVDDVFYGDIAKAMDDWANNGGTFNSDKYVIDLAGGNVTINGGSLKSGNVGEFRFQKAAGKVYIASGVIPADGWKVYSNADTPITLSDCFSLPSYYYVFADDKAIDTLERTQAGVIKFHEHDFTIGADNGNGAHQVDCACGKTINENHRYDETGKCECTAQAVASVIIDGETLYCDTLDLALDNVELFSARVTPLADGKMESSHKLNSNNEGTLTAVVIADQSPSAVSREVIKNTEVKAVIQLVDVVDKSIMASSMSSGQEAQISRLGRGEAYFSYNLLKEPVLVKTPDIRAQMGIKLSVSDEQVQVKNNYWKNHQQYLIPFSRAVWIRNSTDENKRRRAERCF